MHVGTQRGGIRLDNPEANSTLSSFKRHGVESICAFPHQDAWSAAKLSQLRDLVESHGLSLAMVDMPLARTPLNPIMMGKSPERDRDIDEVCLLIRNCAAAGVPSIKYYLSLLRILSTHATVGRGGSRSRTWRLAEYHEADHMTAAGPVPADLMWERITYFLERVIPVANEYKVRMACHPHDVPTPPDFHHIDQVLGTPEGIMRFVSIQESPYHGLNLCLGTTAEMLQDPRNEIFPLIRYFGVRRKIFNIHYRNIRGRRDDFQETYPDEGDLDMLRVALTLKDVEYPYMVMPDHMPSHPDDPDTLEGFAYGYGYIKGAIQAVRHLP
ncbi:MAG: TIM barrel protein [Luteitalea sp.]|nr:TIM barrel protein [Luteitalea sp.]